MTQRTPFMNTTNILIRAIAWIALLSVAPCFAMPPGNPPEDASKPTRSPHHAFSQRDLNDQAATDTRAADREMNRVYAAILSKYAKDSAFIKKFKAAQRAWLLFRDAEVAANYPDMGQKGAHASVSTMCWDMTITELTRQRTRELKSWLKGPVEGDVCASSL
jgi:uncharacterized protein YecT (DUF1311 family)